jgi:hypothetical protein
MAAVRLFLNPAFEYLLNFIGVALLYRISLWSFIYTICLGRMLFFKMKNHIFTFHLNMVLKAKFFKPTEIKQWY